jgi:hypothetical protein
VSQRVLTIRIAAKTIGFIISSLPATVYGKAHYRTLENAKLEALQTNNFNFDAPFRWPLEVREDLLWWQSPSRRFEASFQTFPHTVQLTTDASLEGWGAISDVGEIFGAWEDEYV